MDYIIVDSKTGVQWAEGATFRDENIAHRICEGLKAKYDNPDLVVQSASVLGNPCERKAT